MTFAGIRLSAIPAYVTSSKSRGDSAGAELRASMIVMVAATRRATVGVWVRRANPSSQRLIGRLRGRAGTISQDLLRWFKANGGETRVMIADRSGGTLNPRREEGHFTVWAGRPCFWTSTNLYPRSIENRTEPGFAVGDFRDISAFLTLSHWKPGFSSLPQQNAAGRPTFTMRVRASARLWRWLRL